jgi:NAD(P)-dependent dehydrogenase (short-subunit alcohol dehydrogenase family)
MAQFINKIHKQSYPSISPAQPKLSQAGKSVLITGGSEGVGYAIARSFAQAAASNIIILARRAEKLTSAIEKLRKELSPGFGGRILGYPCDIADEGSVARVWQILADEEGISVDVLVLNAASVSMRGSILKLGLNNVSKDFEVNVFANMRMIEYFWAQNTGSQKVSPW